MLHRFFAPRSLLCAALMATACCTNASAATFETFPYPNNDGFFGVANGGATAVGYGADSIYVLNPDRSRSIISPNAPVHGYSGQPSMSSDGRYIAAGVNGANGYSQAGIYDRSTGNWTALGDLGNGAYTRSGSALAYIYQSSYANKISDDGSTVVGAAAYSATANSLANSYHAAVWRNGQIYDLSATGSGAGSSGIGSSNILTTSADGTLVAGYLNNNDRDSYRVWTWNGSGYTQSFAPTATNPYTGATHQNIQVNALSANGVWGAGGSSRNLGSQSFGPFGNAITFLPATLWNSQTNTTTIIPFDHVVHYDDIDSMYHDPLKNMVASIAGVTNDGTVFGAFNSCLDIRCGATILTVDTFVYPNVTGQSVTFDSYLASMGVALSASQHVTNIFSVSSDGSAIAGYVFDSATNQTSGFLFTNLSAVPEPGSWALMALGLPWLALRRLGQRRNC